MLFQVVYIFNRYKLAMQNQNRVYQIFYSKDLRKKKKTFSEGFLLCGLRKAKLFNSDGQCLLTLNNKHQPQPQEQYELNNTYVVVVEKQIAFEKYISGQIFLASAQPTLPVVKKIVKKSESLKKVELEIVKTMDSGLKIEAFIYDKLRPHQVEGVNFMYECITGQRGKTIEGCILADFMGLGKTLQTLTLIRCAVIQKIAQKIVVVSPLTLVKVWEKQCSKWMGNKLSPLVTLGNPEQIDKTIRMFVDYDYRLLFTSYQQFYRNSQCLGKKCQLLVFDQGHRLKNKKGKLFKKIQTFKCKKRILLTGTPLQNNLEELYTCISIVNPYFFESQTIFKNVFQKPIIAGMAKLATTEERAVALKRTVELASRIKQFSLRRRADVLEKYLPTKRQCLVFLKLSPYQSLIYERIKKKKVNDKDVLSFLNLMRKLFLHPVLFKHDRFQNEQLKDCLEDCREQLSPKTQFVRFLSKECKRNSEKLVVVSYFTESLDFIAEMLSHQQISYVKLDGRIDGSERHRAVESFYRQKTVLLLSGKAGGTGLTLICATKMVMLQPDWNPSNDSQVMGRIWRQGQQKEVTIFRLIVASSFEQKILQRQQLKTNLSQQLIDQNKTAKSYDFFSLKQLFLQITGRCITYPASENRLEECKGMYPEVDWKQTVHVQIKQSHQGEAIVMNEFEAANFEEESDETLSDNQGNPDEIDKYEDIITEVDKGMVGKYEVIHELKEEQTKQEETKLQAQKAQVTQKKLISQIKNQTLPKPQIPLALQKFKRKLRQIDHSI